MRSRSRLLLVIGCLAASLSLAVSPAVAAPALSPPVEDTHVLLPFGATYGSDAHVHRGLDLEAVAGSPVTAPLSGTVTFAGRLPSAEGGGNAVTVTAADGTKVTCSPLAGLAVEKGAAVDAGARLGILAAEGDPSSAEPHLHLSVREGDLYLDPAPLLRVAAPSPSPETPTAPAENPAAAAAPIAPPAAAAPPHATTVPLPVTAAAPPAPAGSRVTAPSPPAAAVLVPHVRAALRRSWPPPLRAAAPAPAAAPDLGPLTSRLRSLTLALGAAMVAAALLVPVVRRRPSAVPGEAVPVRVRA